MYHGLQQILLRGCLSRRAGKSLYYTYLYKYLRICIYVCRSIWFPDMKALQAQCVITDF